MSEWQGTMTEDIPPTQGVHSDAQRFVVQLGKQRAYVQLTEAGWYCVAASWINDAGPFPTADEARRAAEAYMVPLDAAERLAGPRR